MPQLATQAHPPPGRADRQLGGRRQPRRRRAGTIVFPGSRGVEGGGGPGDGRLEALELTLEDNERLAVGQSGGVGVDQFVDGTTELAGDLVDDRHRFSLGTEDLTGRGSDPDDRSLTLPEQVFTRQARPAPVSTGGGGVVLAPAERGDDGGRVSPGRQFGEKVGGRRRHSLDGPLDGR